jgi:hypothetical protein
VDRRGFVEQAAAAVVRRGDGLAVDDLEAANRPRLVGGVCIFQAECASGAIGIDGDATGTGAGEVRLSVIANSPPVSVIVPVKPAWNAIASAPVA